MISLTVSGYTSSKINVLRCPLPLPLALVSADTAIAEVGVEEMGVGTEELGVGMLGNCDDEELCVINEEESQGPLRSMACVGQRSPWDEGERWSCERSRRPLVGSWLSELKYMWL